VPETVTFEPDTECANPDGQHLQLDLARPKSGDGPFPAIRTGAATTCNFDYSGALAETVLLGNVAYRAGGKLTYDVTNINSPCNVVAGKRKEEFRLRSRLVLQAS
jgi:hypothetical protein